MYRRYRRESATSMFIIILYALQYTTSKLLRGRRASRRRLKGYKPLNLPSASKAYLSLGQTLFILFRAEYLECLQTASGRRRTKRFLLEFFISSSDPFCLITRKRNRISSSSSLERNRQTDRHYIFVSGLQPLNQQPKLNLSGREEIYRSLLISVGWNHWGPLFQFHLVVALYFGKHGGSATRRNLAESIS